MPTSAPTTGPARRRRAGGLRLAAALVVGTLALSACGGSDDSTTPTSKADKVSTGVDGVKVSGDYGSEPTVTVPDAAAPTKLSSDVLVEGDGPEVTSGSLLVTEYVGNTWQAEGGKSTVFDSSWKRDTPAAFPIGTGSVISAWDDVLVGQKIGSRVLIVAPPADAYGDKGQADAGIAADTTLVFVVDVVGQFDASTAPASTPTGTTTLGGVTVAGDPGAEPTLTVPAGTPVPTALASAVLAKGQGAAVVGPATVGVQISVVSWDGTSTKQSTWGTAPQALSVGSSAGSTLLDQAGDLKVGDRLLMLLPAQEGDDPATSSYAAVIDIIGVVTRADEATASSASPTPSSSKES